jgi:hypothetical protein
MRWKCNIENRGSFSIELEPGTEECPSLAIRVLPECWPDEDFEGLKAAVTRAAEELNRLSAEEIRERIEANAVTEIPSAVSRLLNSPE